MAGFDISRGVVGSNACKERTGCIIAQTDTKILFHRNFNYFMLNSSRISCSVITQPLNRSTNNSFISLDLRESE